DLSGWISDECAAKLGWRFLEKIIQLPMSVPLLDEDERLPAYLRTLLSGPSPAAAPATPAAAPPALADRLEEVIRGFNPTIETLDEAARRAQTALGVTAARLSPAAHQAADRVFSDLYSDEHAGQALEAALPGLNLTNPREVKRYLNVFRFY